MTDFSVTTSGQPFLVMERLYGATLAEELAARGAFTVQRALEVVRQVLEGLEVAHAAGSSIATSSRPTSSCAGRNDRGRVRSVKILDFGIPKVLASASNGSPHSGSRPRRETWLGRRAASRRNKRERIPWTRGRTSTRWGSSVRSAGGCRALRQREGSVEPHHGSRAHPAAPSARKRIGRSRPSSSWRSCMRWRRPPTIGSAAPRCSPLRLGTSRGARLRLQRPVRDPLRHGGDAAAGGRRAGAPACAPPRRGGARRAGIPPPQRLRAPVLPVHAPAFGQPASPPAMPWPRWSWAAPCAGCAPPEGPSPGISCSSQRSGWWRLRCWPWRRSPCGDGRSTSRGGESACLSPGAGVPIERPASPPTARSRRWHPRSANTRKTSPPRGLATPRRQLPRKRRRCAWGRRSTCSTCPAGRARWDLRGLRGALQGGDVGAEGPATRVPAHAGAASAVRGRGPVAPTDPPPERLDVQDYGYNEGVFWMRMELSTASITRSHHAPRRDVGRSRRRLARQAAHGVHQCHMFRHRPPRHQARERLHHARRRGEAPRLRHREARVRAADATDGQGTPSRPFGTAPYMSPEQARAASSRASDVYALGMTMVESSCGEHPFLLGGGRTSSGPCSRCRYSRPFPPLTDVGFLPGTCRVAERALSKRPQDRQSHGLNFAESFSTSA